MLSDNEKLVFEFKGERDYVQGPDLVNAVLASFDSNGVSAIKMSMHDFITSHVCELVVHDEQPEKLSGKFQGSLVVDGSRRWFELFELDAAGLRPVRCEYDEEDIINNCILNDESVEIKGVAPYTFIENIVSMKKHLLNTRYPRDSGKWVFIQLEINGIYDFREDLKLVITQKLQDKLVRSDIIHNGDTIGKLYFSLVKK